MCSAAPKCFAALAGSVHNATLLGGKKSFDDRDRRTVKEIKHVGMFHRKNSRGLAWPPSPTTLATGSAFFHSIRWWKLPSFTMVRWLQMCSAAPKCFAALAGSVHNVTLLGGKKSFDDRDRGTVKEIKHDHKHPPKADLTNLVCDRQMFSKAGESHLAKTIGGRKAEGSSALPAALRISLQVADTEKLRTGNCSTCHLLATRNRSA